MSIAGTQVVRPGPLPPIAPPDAALEPAPHSPSNAATNPQAAIPLPTRSQWNAAGLSLMFHLLMLLVLAALLIPVRSIGSGTSIDGGIGNEAGDAGDLLDSVTIGSPDPGTGRDIEKSLTPATEGVPAIEGAMAAGSGSGSGTGKGSFDAIASLGAAGGGSGKGVGFFGTRASRFGRVHRRHVGEHGGSPLRPRRRGIDALADLAAAVAEVLHLLLQQRDLPAIRTAGGQAVAGDQRQPSQGDQVDPRVSRRGRHRPRGRHRTGASS